MERHESSDRAHGIRCALAPRSWITDREQCGAAGIPGDTGFATKPELAKAMIERALAAGLPFGWFTADEVYGDNGPLREWLETTGIGYVVAVSYDHHVPAGAGKAIRADTAGREDPCPLLAAGLVRARVQGRPAL